MPKLPVDGTNHVTLPGARRDWTRCDIGGRPSHKHAREKCGDILPCQSGQTFRLLQDLQYAFNDGATLFGKPRLQDIRELLKSRSPCLRFLCFSTECLHLSFNITRADRFLADG